MSFAVSHPNGGSFGGKLLSYNIGDLDPNEHSGGLKTHLKTDIIDSAGLVIYKNRSVANRGQGEKDKSQYEKIQEVFGIDGACLLIRKAALEDIKIKDEYFDQEFFCYKEDIDLAWRLRLYGWENWYVPSAVAYHRRNLRAINSKNIILFWKNRKKMPSYLRMMSVRNHHWMLVKNEMAKHAIIHFPFIFIRELASFAYMLFFEPVVLFKSKISFFRRLSYMLIKRRIIMRHKKVGYRDIKKWFY